MMHSAERLRVPGDPVVPAVPAQFAEKLCLLPRYGRMPVVLTPLAELPQEPGYPVRRRLALYHPSAPPRPLPEVGEAKKVETPRFLVWLRSLRLRLTAGLVETHQTGLVGVEAQPILAESLRQDFQHPPRIALQLEDQNEVIGKADQKRCPLQPGLHHRLKPCVQYLVKVDVRQERRDDSAHAKDNPSARRTEARGCSAGLLPAPDPPGP